MKVDASIELALLGLEHRDEVYRLVDSNRTYLREWLPWLDNNQSPEDTESFIQSAIDQYNAGQGPQYAVFCDQVPCGICGFHRIDPTNKRGGLGYWLAPELSGRGIMTRSVRATMDVGFRNYELNRIEIACATGNVRSRAIAERLGFTFEGVLRERENLYGVYVDHAVYSMLAAEFASGRTQAS